MIDAVYVAATVLFFALMELAYVHGCERLGRTTSTDVEQAGADIQ